MQHIQQIIRQASRRLLAARFVNRTHLLAVCAAALFLLLVLVDRLTAAALPLTWVGAGLAGLVVLSAWVWSLRKRPGGLDVALLVDERLELDERLSTALQCHGLEDSFARAAVEDGIKVAQTPGLHQRINERFCVTAPGRAWLSPLIVAAALACLLLPPRDIFARKAAADPLPSDQLLEITYEIQQQNEQLEAITKELEDQVGVEADGAGGDAEIELPRGDAPVDALRDQLRTITSLQERLEAIQQSDQMQAMRRMQDSLRRLQSPGEGPASDLAQAMQRSDFEQAQREMQELAEKLSDGSLSEQDQQALTEQMESLAQQLDELAAEQQRKLEEALKQAGIDPALASDPQALQQAIQEASNLSEAQKQALQQMAQQNAALQSRFDSMCQACQNAASACQNGNCQAAASALQNMAATMAQLADMKQGAVLSQEALEHLQQLAQACGSCMGGGQGEGSEIMVTQGPVQLPPWKEEWLEELGQGQGGGRAGTGAGGEMPRTETRFLTQAEQLNTFLGEGPIVAQQLVQGTQLRGDSRVTLEQLAAQITEGFEEGLNEDWVPREYQQAVKAYFTNLQTQAGASEETAESVEAGSVSATEPAEAPAGASESSTAAGSG